MEGRWELLLGARAGVGFSRLHGVCVWRGVGRRNEAVSIVQRGCKILATEVGRGAREGLRTEVGLSWPRGATEGFGGTMGRRR